MFSVGVVRIDRLKNELINLAGPDPGGLDMCRGRTATIAVEGY